LPYPGSRRPVGAIRRYEKRSFNEPAHRRLQARVLGPVSNATPHSAIELPWTSPGRRSRMSRAGRSKCYLVLLGRRKRFTAQAVRLPICSSISKCSTTSCVVIARSAHDLRFNSCKIGSRLATALERRHKGLSLGRRKTGQPQFDGGSLATAHRLLHGGPVLPIR